MATLKSLAASTALVLLVLTTQALAQNGGANQDGAPNGKPFEQIQSQFTQMNQRVQSLQTQINSVESSLQTQIDTMNASYAAVHGSVSSVADAIAAINARIETHEGAIDALEHTLGSLQAAVTAVETDLAALTAAYGSDTIEKTAAILALQTQAAQLESLIDGHTQQIATLDGQIMSATNFLNSMANATCAVGQAVSDIGPGGSITCMTPSGGASPQLWTAQFSWGFSAGERTFVVNCPLTYAVMGGGYDGAVGVSVTGSFPSSNNSSYVVRVQSTLPSASIVVFARCIRVSS